MDIEYIRTKAKAGDIDSQKALAHAYLTGDGVSKCTALFQWTRKFFFRD